MVSFDTWNSSDIHQSENENHKKRQSPWPILFDLSPVSWLRLEYVHQLKKMRVLSVLTHRVIPWVQNKKDTRGAMIRTESGPAKEQKSGA